VDAHVEKSNHTGKNYLPTCSCAKPATNLLLKYVGKLFKKSLGRNFASKLKFG
jgi:hypothetical protein